MAKDGDRTRRKCALGAKPLGRKTTRGGDRTKGGPRAIGDVLAELMAQKGFGRIRGAEAFEQAWRDAVGEMAAAHTRVGAIRRGKLEITVANSMLVQELTFQKPALVRTLRERMPHDKIKDLHFRVGNIDD
ncbi:MAG: DUF721 domain-containing protein [Pirellulales bacterium]|nr:DUF721 domain-containing protein [Pirellulales bacterium]